MPRRFYLIYTTVEYDEWIDSLSIKDQLQIDKRIALIELQGYFGDCKSVSDDNSVWELRWKKGRRLYYAHIDNVENDDSQTDRRLLLLVNGGNKNGQKKDIAEAKRTLAKYKQS